MFSRTSGGTAGGGADLGNGSPGGGGKTAKNGKAHSSRGGVRRARGGGGGRLTGGGGAGGGGGGGGGGVGVDLSLTPQPLTPNPYCDFVQSAIFQRTPSHGLGMYPWIALLMPSVGCVRLISGMITTWLTSRSLAF